MTRTKWTLVIGLVVCALAGVAIQQSRIAPDIAFDYLGSGTVPTFVSIVLLILVALMMVEEFIFGGPRIDILEDDEDQDQTAERARPHWSVGFRTGAALVVFLLYLLILEFTAMPFWIPTFTATYLCSRILEGGLGRGRLTSIIVAAVVAGGVEIIFTQVFLIDLP